MRGQLTDFYLNKGNVYARLKEEYLKYGSLIIACDFDDTLYDFHKKGRTYNDVIELLRKWKDMSEIIITSCKDVDDTESVQFIRNYLVANDIPFDKINEQSVHSPTPRATKIYYNVLLDDRAGLSESFEMLTLLYLDITK